ncbi:MAG TPA: glycine cleavage T C-terminal barrel domain-containing protein [Acidimicrobiia bacterium]|nr:glycine cleavage T C-terminal barrel domain-containing protein [Acidimicrobiia bacterium]
MTLPASYGDVTAEYRAARSEAGQVAGLYDLLWFSGPDAISFLESLLSQNIQAQEPGTVRRSFLLGPRGKITALLWVLRDTDRVGLVTDTGYGQVVADTLSRYRIRVKVEVEPEARPLTTVVGPESPAPEGWADSDGVLIAALPLGGNTRSLTTAEPNLRPVGGIAWTAVRVEAGEPVMGVDVDEGTIPQETGLVPEAVDFTKGCFLGQELVARIDSRGHVNQRLMGVIVTTNVIPPSGAEIVAEDKTVGKLTSPTESLTLRSPVGLALIRREVEAGAAVTVRWDGGEATAAVADLPLVG